MKIKQGSKKVTRKAYTTPTLKVYGKVKDLTAGGSGGVTELNNGGNCNHGVPHDKC